MLLFIFQKYKFKNVLFVLLIGYLLFVRLFLVFSFSTDLDGSEYLFVFYVQRLLEHKPIYGNPTEFPYLACIFVPLYLYTLKVLVSAFDLSQQQDIHCIYIVGRFLSFAFFMLHVGVLVAYVRRRFRLDRTLILMLLSVYLLLITGHMYAVRPDAMKFLFFSVAFLVLLEYEFYNRRFIYLITFLLVALLNVFTKQDAVIYTGVLIGAMFFVTRKKRYVLLGIVFLIMVVLLFFLMIRIFGPGFYTNTVLFNFQKIDNVITSYNILFMLFSLVRIVLLLIAAWVIAKRVNLNPRETSMLYYLSAVSILFFVMTHLFMLRAGSYINYAFETIFLCIFLLAFLLRKLQDDVQPNVSPKLLLPAYLLVLFLSNIVIHSYNYSFENEKKIKVAYFENLKSVREIKAKIGNEMVFIPNIRNAFLYKDCNLIYGYDYNVGNFLTLYLPLKMHIYFPVKMQSKLLFFNSDEYDSYFKNGQVAYIINDTERDYFVRENYPEYRPVDTVGMFSLYAFQK